MLYIFLLTLYQILNSELYLSVSVVHCYGIIEKHHKQIKIVFAVNLYGPLCML